MKKTLLLTPLLLLMVSWNSYSASSSIPPAQIKKLTVVSQIVEKNYVPTEETTLVDDVNVATGKNTSTEISITKYDFTYNTVGQMTAVKSYLVENGEPTSTFITTLDIDGNNQLNKVLFGENKMSLDLTYDNNRLKSTEFKDLYYDESRVTTITYNKLDLPGEIETVSQPQYSDPEVTKFIFDPNNNVKIVALDSNKTNYTYDSKKYPFAFLPYSFNVSNYLSASELTYTNYVQQNNVIKIADSNFITTIDYTYNNQNLPLTAKVKTVDKSNPTDIVSQYDYEFIYKDLEITE
ncbi:hypothetical protein AV926_04670 [Myroides marinus]|uniref:YD repeat-containing protein n=1 Tax=Myroides marinus TaxID=703342 RepID=A0A161UB58_9FLAO|nr:hypothetical protein [Myroides marinus]KZE83577.1 hypothetical protein AV926_04670 [Myroides marinus]